MRLGTSRFGLSLVVAAALALPTAALAAPLLSTFGGPSGYGPAGACLKRNDDGFSSAISVTSVFPSGLNFFGTTYNNMYVNTNGSISFSSGISTFTPNAFPGAPQPMIAPFWADVDTRRSSGDGPSGNDATTPTAACPNDTDDEIWWALDPAGGRVVVTWHSVGYYATHTDKRMDYQLVLSQPTSCGGPGGVGNFDVEFRFNQCQWETGDASGGSSGFGGTPAQSGFDSGQTTWNGNPAYVSLPGSRSNGIAGALCAGSNVTGADPGVWRFQVRGGAVQCPNGGAACTVPGKQGVCAQGLTNCVGSGTACAQVTQPSVERCNGLDDDCDAQVDNGTGLCPGSQVCAQGACVDFCFEGSCSPGFTCDTASGGCVESACANVSCPQGQICRGGQCMGPCDGVTCPMGQVCRIGTCLDACAGVTCGTDTPVCEDGVCVPLCGPCRACPSGKDCGASGACVPAGCANVTCGAGEACRAGACVDACTGAVCPPGQACEAGACEDLPPPDAGNPANGGGAGGGSGGAGGGGTGVGGGRGNGSSGVASTSGCSCQTGGFGASVLLALAWLAAFARGRGRGLTRPRRSPVDSAAR